MCPSTFPPGEGQLSLHNSTITLLSPETLDTRTDYKARFTRHRSQLCHMLDEELISVKSQHIQISKDLLMIQRRSDSLMVSYGNKVLISWLDTVLKFLCKSLDDFFDKVPIASDSTETTIARLDASPMLLLSIEKQIWKQLDRRLRVADANLLCMSAILAIASMKSNGTVSLLVEKILPQYKECQRIYATALKLRGAQNSDDDSDSSSDDGDSSSDDGDSSSDDDDSSSDDGDSSSNETSKKTTTSTLSSPSQRPRSPTAASEKTIVNETPLSTDLGKVNSVNTPAPPLGWWKKLLLQSGILSETKFHERLPRPHRYQIHPAEFSVNTWTRQFPHIDLSFTPMVQEDELSNLKLNTSSVLDALTSYLVLEYTGDKDFIDVKIRLLSMSDEDAQKMAQKTCSVTKAPARMHELTAAIVALFRDLDFYNIMFIWSVPYTKKVADGKFRVMFKRSPITTEGLERTYRNSCGQLPKAPRSRQGRFRPPPPPPPQRPMPSIQQQVCPPHTSRKHHKPSDIRKGDISMTEIVDLPRVDDAKALLKIYTTFLPSDVSF